MARTKYKELKPEAIRLYVSDKKTSIEIVDLLGAKYGYAPAPRTVRKWVRASELERPKKSNTDTWKKMSSMIQSSDPNRHKKAMDMLEKSGIDHQVATESILAYWAGGTPRGSVNEHILESWRKSKANEDLSKSELAEQEPVQYKLPEAA